MSILPTATGDLALSTSDADGDQAILWLTGGQAGTNYSVTVSVTTNSGRSIVRTIYLPVIALSVTAPSGAALTDQSGAALTDQTGVAITV